ncbi:putative FMN/FAD exporter YeeO [bioreactor metagenome]|uniref:Multidrug-efflux transporter n=1 Tax=bioreactor metagenome TaxID=1076179 RepID=A0A644XSI1_9ZZZZ
MNSITRFFSCEAMVKPSDRCGPLPTTKEGYFSMLSLAWPCMVEALLLCAVSFADTIMVGTLGPEAISAVGITTQPKYIMLSAILSLNIGVTAVVARRKGQEDRDGANRCMKQCLILCLLLAAALTALGIACARPLIAFAGADFSILDDATIYFQIVMLGHTFSSLTLTINAAQRGCGNTRISMTTNLAANLVNILFNYLLINGIGPFPRLEVAGAAIATSLGSVVSFFLALASILRRDSFVSVFTAVPWRFDKTTLSSVNRVALSAMAEQVCLRIGFFAYAKIVASLGTLEFAVHQICMNIINITFAVGDGLGTAVTTLVGQSLGRSRPDMGKLYSSLSQRVAFIICSFLSVFFYFGRYWLISLFNTDPRVLSLGGAVMVVIACIIHVQTAQIIMFGCLRGAGDTRFTAMVSLASVSLIRPTLTWFLAFPMGLGLIGAWVALALDQIIRMATTVWRVGSGKWAQIKL